jgi:pimeloyl-ACP methyl ester carboxylesterase
VSPTVGDFLRPDGFERPGVAAVLREGSLVREAGRYALRRLGPRPRRDRTPYAGGGPRRDDPPVLLVPGFLAGDGTLALMQAALRHEGFRTYRSHIHANAGCTQTASLLLEQRVQAIATRRGSRVRIVGHSLGGMLGRGIAARRPDLVSGIVTLGSPVLAPGAHHVSLARGVDVLVRLSRAGVPGLMSEDCVGGDCARRSWDETRVELDPGVDFTAIYSRRDGIVDWRACIPTEARGVEVRASHIGMAVDPHVVDEVVAALRTGSSARSALEVDGGEIA